MNIAVRVRSTIWVGERQIGRRSDGVMVMNVVVQVRSTVWVGEM